MRIESEKIRNSGEIIELTHELFRDTLDVVKQSAALCLLRLFRTDPAVIPSGQ